MWAIVILFAVAMAIIAIEKRGEERDRRRTITTVRHNTPLQPLADPSEYNEESSFSISRGGSAPAPRNGLWMPEHIKKQLLAEIAILEHELSHELPAEIKKAVAMGDLSENAEYHMAKQRQTFVNARLGQLKKRMAELSLVNLTNIPRDKAGFGSTVVVFDSTKDEEIVYRLVTSEESDVSKGLISTTSPIGHGLVGKKVGDVATIVTPNGKRELEILKLTTIHDEADESEAGEASPENGAAGTER
jgi:transcription elongation factor GreA